MDVEQTAKDLQEHFVESDAIDLVNKICDAVDVNIPALSRVGVSMSRFDQWRVKFWYFWHKENRAQQIILAHLNRELHGN